MRRVTNLETLSKEGEEGEPCRETEKDQTREYICKEYLLFRIFDGHELEFMRTKIPKSALGRKDDGRILFS